MFGFSSGSALSGQVCPIELFGVITTSGKEYPSFSLPGRRESPRVPYVRSRQKEPACDSFHEISEKTLQRLISHREGSHCSSVNVWGYDIPSGRLELIASTTDDSRQVIPNDDELYTNSVPPSLFVHIEHHCRQGTIPPPVQYADGAGRFVLILPTAQHGNRVGFACLFHNDLVSYTEADLDVLYLLSESLVNRFYTSEYYEDRQLEIRRGEQQRIARNLHDTIVQDAAGAVLQLENASLSLTERNTDTNEVRQHVLLASGLTRRVVEQLRRLVWSLHDSSNESTDAPGAIQESFVHRAIAVTQKIMKPFSPEIGVHFSVLGEEFVFPRAVSSELSYLLRESLNNVVKHANASRVDVTISFCESSMQIQVTDNGQGFDRKSCRYRGNQTRQSEGFGMIGMRERARALGAKLTISTTVGKGTRVRMFLPGLVRYGSDL